MAKFKIAYIVNKKARVLTFKRPRVLTFKRRKEGLIKKLQELVTLCGVEACIFVHNPDADLQQPDAIWPPGDPGAIRPIVDLYRAKKTDSGTQSLKTCGPVDFNDQGQSSAVAQSSGMMLMPMIPYSDCSSIDPLGMMDAVFGSQDWAATGDLQEFGSQFFTPYGYIPPSRHSTVCSASSEHYVNLADLCHVVRF